MLNVRKNYQGSYSESAQYCPVCCDPSKSDNQEHIPTCDGLLTNQLSLNGENFQYSDIFIDQLSRQIGICLIRKEKMDLCKRLLAD